MCESKYFLVLDHHIKAFSRPFSLRGPSTVENLRLLCRSHNVLAAIQSGFCPVKPGLAEKNMNFRGRP